MAVTDSDAGFWDHVEALRATMLRMVGVLVLLFVGWFCVMPGFFDHVLLAPCRAGFPLYHLFGPSASEGFPIRLININLASQMFVHLSASFSMALVTGFPILIYLLWRFVRPGLYDREKRHAVSAFLTGNFMFYLGVAAGYLGVFPLCLRFLATYQLSPDIPNVISLDSYMDNMMMIVMLMGVLFEMPLLGWLLGRMGLLRRGFFGRYRRHAIVVLLIAAALITPTGDPVTLFIVFAPLYLLYELTALLVPCSVPQQ